MKANLQSADLAAETPHVVNFGAHPVVISGDTAPLPQMANFARGADILIHEIQRPDPGMAKGGKMQRPDYTQNLPGHPRVGVGHSTPSQVGVIAQQAGAKMLVAYHLAPYTSVSAAIDLSSPYSGAAPGFQIWSDYVRAIAQSYHGKIVIGEDAMVFNIGKEQAGSGQ